MAQGLVNLEKGRGKAAAVGPGKAGEDHGRVGGCV